MTHRILDKISSDPARIPRFGADLEVKAWGEVSPDRVESLPLTFVGRQLSRHWSLLNTGEALVISLWQRKKSGFVLAFSTWSGERLGSEAVAVDSLGEAMSFLEDYCAHPPKSATTAEQLIDSIIQLHKSVNFLQVFSALAGDALAIWSDLGPTPTRGRNSERASA